MEEVPWEEKQHRALMMWRDLFGDLSQREVRVFQAAFELGVGAGQSSSKPLYENSDEYVHDVVHNLSATTPFSREFLKKLPLEQLWWFDILSAQMMPFTRGVERDDERSKKAMHLIREQWSRWETEQHRKQVEAEV